MGWFDPLTAVIVFAVTSVLWAVFGRLRPPK